MRWCTAFIWRHIRGLTQNKNITLISKSFLIQKPDWLHVSTSQGLCSLSSKTSYCLISLSIEAAILGVLTIVSLWNLRATAETLLSRCLLNFTAIWKVQIRISRLRDFTRSCGKTSNRFVNKDQEWLWCRSKLSNQKNAGVLTDK